MSTIAQIDHRDTMMHILGIMLAILLWEFLAVSYVYSAFMAKIMGSFFPWISIIAGCIGLTAAMSTLDFKPRWNERGWYADYSNAPSAFDHGFAKTFIAPLFLGMLYVFYMLAKNYL